LAVAFLLVEATIQTPNSKTEKQKFQIPNSKTEKVKTEKQKFQIPNSKFQNRKSQNGKQKSETESEKLCH
jgi:hypothetical protein